jgi:hypothetical protein
MLEVSRPLPDTQRTSLLTCVYTTLQGGRQIVAGGSLLRSGQTQVGEPKISEHAQ